MRALVKKAPWSWSAAEERSQNKIWVRYFNSQPPSQPVAKELLQAIYGSSHIGIAEPDQEMPVMAIHEKRNVRIRLPWSCRRPPQDNFGE